MKHLITNFLCPIMEFPFVQRIYLCLCFSTFIGVIFLTTIGILNHQYPETYVRLSIVLFSGTLYYFARFRKKFYNLLYVVFYALITIISYFIEFGLHNAFPFTSILTLIIMLAYSPVKLLIPIGLLHFMSIASVVLIKYSFPKSLLNSFTESNSANGHLFSDIVSTVFFLFVIIYFLEVNCFDEQCEEEKEKTNLKDENLQKSMFFINLSHEIKTPLTLIENYLDRYIATKGDDEELLLMKRNIEKLRKDILDYLHIEKLEHGNFSYEIKENLLYSSYLKVKISFFAPYADNNNINLNYDIEPDISIKINLKGIDQVLNNILENAVKYTPANGNIYILLKKDNDKALLTVNNSGPGIPEEQLSQLFEPFYQLSNQKLNQQGIGMGLYITKKIIEVSGGNISISSKKKEGVLVTVSIPLSHDQTTEELPEQSIPILKANKSTEEASDSSYFVNRPNLLLVEDNIDLLRYLVKELSENYNIFTASDGMRAIRKLDKIPVPDLIISDIMMDKMDGYELLHSTINDARFEHVPFIFLTAKDNPGEKAHSMKLGALDFISKPFSIDELKAKVNAIIDQKARITKVVIRNIKQQFTESHFLKNNKPGNEILNINALRFKLTAREKEIIIFIRQGMKYEDISEKLCISEHTVVRHVQNIYKKTESCSKIDMLQKVFTSSLMNKDILSKV